MTTNKSSTRVCSQTTDRQLSTPMQMSASSKMPNSSCRPCDLHGFCVRCFVQSKQLQGHCSVAGMSFGWRCDCPRRPLPLFTLAIFSLSPSAAQHAFLEDIQSLWPAGATPSTGVWVPVTAFNSTDGLAALFLFLYIYLRTTHWVWDIFFPQVWVTNSKWS